MARKVVRPDRTVGFAVVAWIAHVEEWGVFAQGEKRDLMVQLRDRLEAFGLIARVVDCELCEGGEVNLFEPLGDPEVSDRPSIDVDRSN